MRERARRNRGGNSDSAFAATSIDLTRTDDRRYAASVITNSQTLSRTSWDWYDKLGEIHYGVSRSAKVGGYAELGVYRLGKNGEIESQVTSGLAGEIASMLYSPYGGVRGLIERFITLMKIPADSFLIEMFNGNEPDGFDFVSADELRIPDGTSLLDARQGGSIERITLPAKSRYGESTAEVDRITPAAFYGRVWRPSSRFVDLPDSPMQALNTTCEQLHLLTVGLRSKLLSRLASNGIVFVPSEINDVRSSSPTGDSSDMMSNNKVINEFLNAAMYAARNPSDPAAALPIFVSGPSQFADGIRHIVLDQQIYETDMKLRAELIDRILTGLDIQPSQVKGSQDANHWSAWSASEDELRVSVKPDLETMCWALTRLVLWKRMQEAGQKPGAIQKHIVWFDMSRAQSHQNVAEDARQLSDRLLISPTATRQASGFEERDAPDEKEYIRMVGTKMDVPYLALYGLEEAKNVDWEKVASKKTGPSADSPAEPSSAQPGKGQPGSPSDTTTKTPARLRPA
jgi:hypothetical protein